MDLVLQRASEIRSIAAAHGARNVRVVGSVARGTDRADSDLDLLVTLDPGVGLLTHAKLVLALEQRHALALEQRHADVPWSAIGGMRNVLVHDYFGIDLAEVCSTVEQDLPVSRAQLDAALAGLDESPS